MDDISYKNTGGIKMRKIILFIFAMVAINAAAPTYENVTRLYVATFDRTPDVVGLKYWVNDSGLDLEDIARSFFDQPETKAKYYPDGTIYLSSFVDEIYVNLFNRSPDSAGKEYWVDYIMAGGFERVSVFILAVINGAQGNDATILADKTQYAYDAIKDQLDDGNIGACRSFNADGYYEVIQGRLELHCAYYSAPSSYRLFSQTPYADGLKHGAFRSYHRDGSRATEGDYWNGHKIGTWKSYYIEGTYENIEAYCNVYDDDGNWLRLISDC